MSPWQALKRAWLLHHLGDTRYRFMWDAAPRDEWVAFDCETTGLDVRHDEIVAIGAVRIAGDRVLTSCALDMRVRPARHPSAESIRVHRLRAQDVATGLAPEEAMDRLMRFIGSRPVVGYYLSFDLAMTRRVLFPMIGMGLPQAKIDISGLYYDWQNRRLPPGRRGGDIDLRFATLMRELELPLRDAHDALNDAVMTALAFVKLRHLARGPA
jgi:DNA polymerase-3 subunit epsilon